MRLTYLSYSGTTTKKNYYDRWLPVMEGIKKITAVTQVMR